MVIERDGTGEVDIESIIADAEASDDAIKPDGNEPVKADAPAEEVTAKADGEAEGGSETTKPAETVTPEPIDLSAPGVKEQLNTIFNGWIADAKVNATRDVASAEIAQLVRDGDHKALGEKFAEAYVQLTMKQSVGGEVLQNFTKSLYNELYEHEAFANLTDDDRKLLDPRQYKSDGEYIKVLNTFMAQYEVGKLKAAADGEVTGDTETAKENVAVAERVAAGAAVTLPAGNSGGKPNGGTDFMSTSGRDLLRQGLADMLDKEQ